MTVLDDGAISQELDSLPEWERRGNEIVKTFKRKNFVGAIEFVNQVATLAEEQGHHPDIDIRWNKVTLTLSTHSAGGLTMNDFELAKRIEAMAAQL